MELTESIHFFKHIKRDFPIGEYPPYAVLYKQMQDGRLEGLVFSDGDCDLAYSVCAVNHENSFVLISLFAVIKAYRAQGIGSAFLIALEDRYKDMQGIIVEVERPELSKTKGELLTSERRIKFYERAGFYLIKGIDYTIWHVPMHLMALPLKAGSDEIDSSIGEIMHRIYLELMGKLFIGKMQLKVL